MPNRAGQFDPYLMDVRSNELKRMAGLWVKAGKLCKADCAAAIRAGLAAPDRVPAALAKLDPPERTALAFIKEAGGELDADCLEAAMATAGHVLRGRPTYSSRNYPWSEKLIKRGVVLTQGGYEPASTSTSAGETLRVFSDGRLLAHVHEPEIVAFEVEAELPAEAGIQRPPGSVVLDIIAVLQSIENMGGMGFTQAGLPRVSDMKKLRRALQWTDDMKVDGVRFPNLAEAVVTALRAACLLEQSSTGGRVVVPLAAFASRLRAEQVRPVVHGFANAEGWTESGWCGKDWNSWRHGGYPPGRHALITGLRALRAGQPGFFTIDRFDEALFERIGEQFSLNSHMPPPPYVYGVSGDELRRKQEEWRRTLRNEWLGRERKWIESALSTWLYWLGLVELSIRDGAVAGFRLTDLGRQVFHDDPPTLPAAEEAAGSADAWVVQPNFDVLVYVEKASPGQLAFIERIAERQRQSQRHVAHYVLTRDSLYRALEGGCTLDDVLDGLRKGSDKELPPNVAAELRGSAGLREQIVVRRKARLLEFPNEARRRSAIEGGEKGQVVGDRFLLLDGAKGGATASPRKIEKQIDAKLDYTQPLPACLTVQESGSVHLSTRRPDLLICGQLDVWAERDGQNAWRLTEKSVRAATEKGRSVDELLGLLDSRTAKTVPHFLRIALQAWSGKSFEAQLGKVAVLRCPQPDVFHAVAAATRAKRSVLGRLGPDTFLVDGRKLKDLKEALRWAGIEIAEEVTPREMHGAPRKTEK